MKFPKLLFLCVLILSTEAFSQGQRREVTVSLYPFIPNADNFYRKTETAFEKKYPEINLIIQINPYYYDEKTGIINEQADVYEIDCVFLKDFIAKKKIQAFPKKYIPDEEDLMPAGKIVKQNNLIYSIPHWLCGNFLFYDKNDTAIKKSKTLKDLESIIGIDPALKNGILIDLKGRLTLGEMYADAISDESGDVNSVIAFSNPSNINQTAVANLNRIPKMTYSTWGRDDNFHDKSGFYQRQFAKGNGRVFAGYSESLYQILDEIRNSCSDEETCLKEENIEVKELSLSDKGSTPIGWIDGLSLNSNLTAQKLEDAIRFIDFFASSESYYMALVPEWGVAPRYLLPAYKKYYTDTVILKTAPLYQRFYELAIKINTVTLENMNENLRAIGRKLDKEFLQN